MTEELLASLEASSQGVAEAVTLPPALYTSEEVLEFERDAIYAREWLCVGRAERIPEPGDWFTVNIAREPIIVVRDKEGDVRAMSAVCQHRAMQVCEGEGNTTTFKCPYHHWIYGLDGRLLGAPAMERTENFEKSDWGLPQMRVELWMGFIFVNLDADAAPLSPTLERYSKYLVNYDLENAVCPGT
ncbi:MAG: aromatic ring-hydroxylating oxygenase subunit alpha, partial [Ilumatobacteraceae bacterium]